jgi:hypothetical protein
VSKTRALGEAVGPALSWKTRTYWRWANCRTTLRPPRWERVQRRLASSMRSIGRRLVRLLIRQASRISPVTRRIYLPVGARMALRPRGLTPRPLSPARRRPGRGEPTSPATRPRELWPSSPMRRQDRVIVQSQVISPDCAILQA